jgi:uncharacterized protein YjbI with pentapeptide repeats
VTSFYASTQLSSDKLLAELIKRIRNTNNLTQADFGRLFQPQVTQSTVARWEKGEQIPDGIHFPKIAFLLDLTFEELLKLLENPLTDVNSINIENKTLIPNKRHFALLKKGRRAWNKWRENNPDIIPQLSGINLLSEDLRDLEGYNLNDANLAGVSGTLVSFQYASLVGANLEKANFKESNFDSANLTNANLKNIVIADTSFARANLKEANLQEALIRYSNFRETNLEQAELHQAELVEVDLSKAILRKAKLIDTTLHKIDFREANLNEASLEKAIMTDCYVYGVAFIGTNLSQVKLKNVYISPEGKKGLPINNLTTAQITYLHRYHPAVIQQFLQVCQLEEEMIRLAHELANKYGEYCYRDGKRIYLNLDDYTSSQTRPLYQIERVDDTLSIKTLPDFKHKEVQLSPEKKYTTILHIENGITESCLAPIDLENLKTIFQLEAKNQNKNVAFIAPLVEEILNNQQKSKIVGKNYILEKDQNDLIINKNNQVELMRTTYQEGQWIIINSSLSDNDFNYFQKLKPLLEQIENSQPKEKAKLSWELVQMI